jgi:GNAT superfamily N-acetyltransferase
LSTDGQQGVIVRPVAPGDEAALTRIHAEMGAYYAGLAPEQFQVPAPAALELPADEQTLWLVAVLDGEVAATVVARVLAPEPGADEQILADLGRTRLVVDYLATAEAHRRGGIATRLVDAAEAWGRERGATVAETSTFADSPLSRPFWERRMGYAVRSVKLHKRL